MSPSLGLLVLALMAGGAGPSFVGAPRAAAASGLATATPALPGAGRAGPIAAHGSTLGAVSAPAARLPGSPDDPWVGQDKLQHLGMSFAMTSFGYGAARLALDRKPATLAAAGAALAAGVAKELLDLRAGRRFSARDLLWDAAGVAAALTIVDRTR